MSGFRRLFQVFALALIVLVALDDNARTMTGGFFQNGYAYVTGAGPAPLPLERPAFLGLADLDDCLRGSGHVEGDDAYAAFCADLASFAEDRPQEPGKMETATLPAAAVRQRAKIASSAKVDCFVDARGVPARMIDGIWVKAEAETDDAGTWSGKPSRLVTVPPRCQVQSPAEANVLYAGYFKGYRGVIILETEKKDRITIAGLGRVGVERGDRVVLGGKLGETSEALAPALAGAANGRGPAVLLYVADGGTAGPAS